MGFKAFIFLILTLVLSLQSLASDRCKIALETLTQMSEAEKMDPTHLHDTFARLLIFETPLFSLKGYVKTKVNPVLKSFLSKKGISGKSRKAFEGLSLGEQNEVAEQIWRKVGEALGYYPQNLGTYPASQLKGIIERAKTDGFSNIEEGVQYRAFYDHVNGDVQLRRAAVNTIRVTTSEVLKLSSLTNILSSESKNHQKLFSVVQKQDLTLEVQRVVIPEIPVSVSSTATSAKFTVDVTPILNAINSSLASIKDQGEGSLLELLTSKDFPILFNRNYFEAFMAGLNVKPDYFLEHFKSYSKANLDPLAEEILRELVVSFGEFRSGPIQEYAEDPSSQITNGIPFQQSLQASLLLRKIWETPELKLMTIKIIKNRMRVSAELAVAYAKAKNIESKALNLGANTAKVTMLAGFGSMIAAVMLPHAHLGLAQELFVGGVTAIPGSLAPIAAGGVYGLLRAKPAMTKFDKKVQAMRERIKNGDSHTVETSEE